MLENVLFKMRRMWILRLIILKSKSQVFDEILFCENFAKLATKRFLCFAKMRDEFREFRSFTKLLIL
jgi:hypothetical protein